MHLATSVALFALGALVNAQSNDDNALGIAAIEAHFSNADLVPSLIPSFDPSAVMTVTFPGVGAISPGQSLSKDQVAPTPQVSLVPANSSVTLQGNYTLVMADADIVGTDESVGQTRHWLVNGVTLAGTSPLNVSTSGGVAVTQYAGPAPADGSGPHRYVILLLPQPSTFSPPANLTQPNIGVSVFHLTDYITTSHLGPPVAAMYFDVQQGTATVTPPQTSPVVSSTLKPATATSSSPGSSASSSSTSSSNTAVRFGGATLALPATFFAMLVYACL
ncbi:phosphatidylethanolamine-binding protein [Gloeopeniophorella convolvens]|nr:phosphatidylethanolamine-binding protein [Gloeopeniophorella convolvens]